MEGEEVGGDVAIGVGEVGEECAGEFELADDDLEDGLEDVVEGDGGVDGAGGFEEGLKARDLLLRVEGFVLVGWLGVDHVWSLRAAMTDGSAGGVRREGGGGRGR